MSAHRLRREADIVRLRALAARSGGRVEVLAAEPEPGPPIRVGVRCRTAGSDAYPASAQGRVAIRIDLPARYPFERPVVTIETPVFHPNVFPNGVVCQGDRWLPSEGLDLLLMRIIRLVTFEPAHVNPASAANRSAANWYQREQARSPGAFPTDAIDWQPERVVVPCPRCGRSLRLPAGRRGIVACPGCREDVEIAT